MINGNPKERPGGRDVILGGIFAKVLKGSERFLACLDLIDEQQGFAGHDALPCSRLNRAYNRIGVETARKVRPRRLIVLEIDVDDRLEKGLRVCSEQIGLAALPNAFD